MASCGSLRHATVIIGNPASLTSPSRRRPDWKDYQTNMIVLDDMGNPIADTLIEVVRRRRIWSRSMGGASLFRLLARLPAHHHARRLIHVRLWPSRPNWRYAAC
jgi:hypothetical protein